MKYLNLVKNLVLTVTITLLYAIWCTDALHEMSGLRMWLILIAFGALVLHILLWVDREVARIQKERLKKKERNKEVT